MTDNPWIVGLLALGGAWMAFRSQLSALARQLQLYFIGTVRIENSPLSAAFRAYCFQQLERSRFGVRHFAASTAFVRPLHALRSVGYERICGDLQIFWRGRWPLAIQFDPGKEGGLMYVRYIRGTFDVDKALLEALDYYDGIVRGAKRRYYVKHVVGKRSQAAGPSSATGEQGSNRQIGLTSVLPDSRLLGWQAEDIGPPVSPGSSLSNMILPSSLDGAIAEARFWRRSEGWYHERSIPWKRGWMLHGAPGTGKTSLARALAEELDLPVYSYDLASLSSEELYQHWSEMLREAPCMALIEDVDIVFKGRERAGDLRDKMGFNALLNCIDGVERNNGLFLVITTNNIAEIDAALGVPHEGSASTRPGRIDRAIEMISPDRAGLERLCERILPDAPQRHLGLVEAGLANRETVAQFQERCSQASLEVHWERFDAGKDVGRVDTPKDLARVG